MTTNSLNKKIVLLFIFAVFVSCFVFANETASETNKSLARLVDFGSKQCRACKAMESVLAACEEKYSDKFITEFIDVWLPENQDSAKQHQIRSIPTQVFFNESGEELYRHVGFISEEDILAKWAELGYGFSLSSDKKAE